jgi:hypothetical protein
MSLKTEANVQYIDDYILPRKQATLDLATYNRDPADIAKVQQYCSGLANQVFYLRPLTAENLTTLTISPIPQRADLRKWGTIPTAMD